VSTSISQYAAALILTCITGTSGAASNYYTRSQAVRKLQISLGDFRRLCIFKGIYPREPRSKKRVSKSSTPSTTFYYAKDIQYLLHEPLLAKFRDQKALAKKISKALGRNEVSDAVRLERNLTPKLRLDHIIKERYPTFVDALRDLDDALSMLFLFANLPSTSEVPAKIIARCQRLTTEFEHYLIRTHCLRKSFLSIKGIYYQATIQGQDILWLVPYKFVQRTGADVDYRIMATFVDFYTTLLGFVNFRLYTSIGLVYPPRFDAKAEEEGADLGAYQLEGRGEGGQAQLEGVVNVKSNEKAQAEADRLLALPADEDSIQENERSEQGGTQEDVDGEDQPQTALDQFAPIDDKADDLLQPSATADAAAAGQLFEQFTFFLSRETPRHPLEFIVRAFGCKRVGWDTSLGDPGSYCSEDDKRITHQVVDRPDLPLSSPPSTEDEAEPVENTDEAVVQRSNERVPGRIYVQPQWVWDSINAGQLQRPDLYAPGATLPPHLSPWVKPKRGDYDPTIPLAEQETEAELEIEEEDEQDFEGDISIGAEHSNANGIDRNEDLLVREDGDEEDGGMDVELAASDEEVSDEEPTVNGDDEWGGLSGDEGDGLEDKDAAGRQAQAELEAEALGRQPSKEIPKEIAVRQAAQAKRTKAELEAQEDLERRKMMMPRRKRKVYEKMAYSNAKKDEEAQKLRAKRRKIEKSAGGSS
jgi:pescadillo protein